MIKVNLGKAKQNQNINFYNVKINGNSSKNSPFNEILHGRVRNIYDRTAIVHIKENSDDIDALNSIKYNYSNNMLNITLD